LAAGLGPDPLGELTALPKPSNWTYGKGKGGKETGKGRDAKGKEWKGHGGKRKGEKKGKGDGTKRKGRKGKRERKGIDRNENFLFLALWRLYFDQMQSSVVRWSLFEGKF